MYITKDALLHVALIIGLWVITIIPFLLLPPVVAAGISAAWQIYFREVIQVQSKTGDFRTGWNPFKWSQSKNIETWFPIILFMILVSLVQIVLL